MFLARKFEFESAHFYNFGGKLKNLHGHNYEVWVIVKGKINDLGMVMNISEIKEKVNPIIERFDHTLLNSMPEFEGLNPTVEIISKVLYENVKGVLENVYSVKVFEDEDVFGAYDGKNNLLGSFKWLNFNGATWKYETWVKGYLDNRGIVEDLKGIFTSPKRFFERYERVEDKGGYILVRGERLNFKTYKFSAAHILGLKTFKYEENLKVFGKCAKRESHGHNYLLVVFSKYDKAFSKAERVVKEFDHNILNDFIDNPTLENIAEYIFNKTQADILKIYETPRTYAVISKNHSEIIPAI